MLKRNNWRKVGREKEMGRYKKKRELRKKRKGGKTQGFLLSSKSICMDPVLLGGVYLKKCSSKRSIEV